MTEATSPAGGRPFPTHTVVIPDDVEMVSLLGPRDEMLRTIERAFPRLVVHARGNEVYLTGTQEEIQVVEQLIDELLEILGTGEPLNRDAVERSIHMLRDQTRERPAEVLTQNIVSSRGRTIRPKTLGQKKYVDAIDTNTVVFGIGPAGTGKTYLAMAKAVAALQAKEVTRILLTRPAVEAGERLGFLPGTLTDKIDPYLRPLYDALHDMIDPESIPRLMASGTIEVAPLAFMRGRAQPVDTSVLTPIGWRRFGDLEVGDPVIGSDGRPTPVIGVYPQGVRQVFRVATADGASTLACAEHLWTVRTGDGRGRVEPHSRWQTVRTEEMVASLRDGGGHRFELPLVQAVELVEQDLPMDPYALGRLLARGQLATSTAPALAMAGAGGPAPSSPDAGALREVGLDSMTPTTAYVPEVYLINAPRVRRALLQGLLDCDWSGDAHRPADGLRFTTRSARLRDDVTFLARSLGGIVSAREEARGAYVLDLRLPEAQPRRYVQSIEPEGEAETLCIQVAAADSLYVTEDLILTHNTLNDAFIILDEAQNTSPEQMKMFLTRLGFGSKMVVTGDITQVDLPGGMLSGLRVVRDILEGLDDVHFAELTAQDVVRHRLVGAIVDAYGQWDARQGHQPGDRPTDRRSGDWRSTERRAADRRPTDRRPGRRHEPRREGTDPA